MMVPSDIQQDEAYMKEAYVLAERAFRDDKLPVGAVVVCDGRIIGRGWKRKEGHLSLDHAEMEALRDAIRLPRTDGRGCMIFTTLEPCAMCFGALVHNHIDRVVFGLEDPYGGATATDFQHVERHAADAPLIQGGVLRAPIATLFRKYFQQTQDPFWQAHRENSLVQLVAE